VNQLAKQTAEIALRLAALPAEGLRNNPKALAEVEELARVILKEVALVRAGQSDRPAGETRGMWRATLPAPRF
jgi:hypothetical protein